MNIDSSSFTVVCQHATQVPSNLPALIGWIVGFITAIFAEPIRNFLFKPKLELSFGTNQDFITDTPVQISGGNYQAKYVRVKVVNVKRRLAKGCRAFLVNFEMKDKNGNFQRTDYCDSLQLAWSCQNPGNDAIDLPFEVNQFIDIFRATAKSNSFEPCLVPIPFRYSKLFQQNGVYRFTIQVAGEGLDSQKIVLILDWRGEMNEFTVQAG